MNDTLNQEPTRSVLDRLFEEARTSDARVRARLAEITPAERERLLERADYRELYGALREEYLAVSRDTGALLYALARAARARHVVEFGTSFGVSTIYLAAAVKDAGSGSVIATELEPAKAARARENLRAAGLAELVELREGDALETLARDLPDAIDLVLFDGAKPLYARVLDLVEPRLRSGAILVADNAARSPAYLERVRAAGYVSCAAGDDVELSVRC
ncbi:MAG: class I SAM-dependent methyltransferase [Polyangiaceae bacterium]